MIGLALAFTLLALLVLLPLVTSARVLRLHREIEDLRERITSLEALLRAATGPGPAERAAREAEPVAPVAPVAPEYRTASIAPAAPVEPAPPDEESLDLEGQIGGRWLLYTGVLVLLFGISFFLKYAFDNAWIDERGRVIAGGLTGFGLILGGWRLSARGLGAFGQALIGAGLAVLYLAIYAALVFYALIGNTPAFVMMVVVTMAAAALSDQQRSQALAFIAVGGGFLTPFLVGGSEDAQLTLFTYDAVLVAGTMLLARRHDWFALNALSYVFTVATVIAWASVHYRESVWLRTLLFLTLYCAMFVQILRDTRRAPGTTAKLVAALLMTAPVLYHIAAVVLTARHPPAIHVYMIAFAATGLWLTAEPHRPGLRLLVLAGSYLPLFGTLTLPAGLSWIIANTITIAAVAALHLLALVDRVFRQHCPLARSELAALHVIGIGVYALLYQTLEPAYPEFRGALGAILAMGAIVLWQSLQPRDRVAALNACAVAFTLAAIAVAVQFDRAAVVAGWAAEGAAAAWVGLRVASPPMQAGGLMLWALAVVRLLDGYFDTPAGFTALLNERTATTIFVVALGYVLGWLFVKYRDVTPDASRTRAVLHVVAAVVTTLWITAEVRSYWEVRYLTPQAYLYEQLVLSLTWSIYGALLIVTGMWRAYAPDRYLGITVLAITVLKVFLYDLWELGGIYRVIGFIAFGVLLVAVSYLYQQRRMVTRATAAPHVDDVSAAP